VALKIGGTNGLLSTVAKALTKPAPKPAPAPAPKPAPAPAPKLAATTPLASTSSLPLVAATAAPPVAPPATSTDPAHTKPIFDEIRKLTSSKVQFVDDGKSKWSVGDAQALLGTIQKMSPTDRAYLGQATFKRQQSLPPTGDWADNYGTLTFQAVDRGGPFMVTLTDVASREGVVGDVAAHELGHAVMGGGRWDASMLREFSKFSHWERPDGTLFNGYDKAHTPVVDGEPGLVPKNTSNFVVDKNKGYSLESPAEDFAESYRAYLTKPDYLMKVAPDKFLFLNSNSRKFTPAEVQKLAADAGVDLPLVMAQLKNSNLRAETLTQMEAVNGLQGAGGPGSAAGDVIAAIQKNAGNAAWLTGLKADPAKTLGPAWAKLTPAEQKLLSSPAYIDKLAAEAKINATAARDTIKASDIAVMKEFFKKIALNELSNGDKFSMSNEKVLGIPVYKLGSTPDKSPEQARFDYFMKNLKDPAIWNRLSPEMQAFLNDPKTQKGIWNQVNDDSAKTAFRDLQGGFKVFGIYIGGTPKDTARTNVTKAIDWMGPAEMQAWIGMVGSADPGVAKTFGTQLNSLVINGSLKTDDGIGM